MKKYFSFEGTATRSEYWAVLLISLVLAVVMMMFGAGSAFVGSAAASGFVVFLGLAIIFAAAVLDVWLFIATTVRRLRDADLTPWWTLASFIPYIGWIPVIVFGCLAGKKPVDQ